MVLLRDGQGTVKGATRAPRHVLRAQDGPVQRLQTLDAGFKSLGPAIVMESDDVRLRKLDLCRVAFLGRVGPVAFPHAAGKRLHGMHGARPGESLRQ